MFCLDLFYSTSSPALPVSHCLAFLTSPRCSGLYHLWRLVGKPPPCSKLVSQSCLSETSLRKFFLLSPSGTCVLFHTSGYDSQAMVKNNGSTEYGLFQISNRNWCKSSEFPKSENICDISCDSEYPLSSCSSVSPHLPLSLPKQQECWVPCDLRWRCLVRNWS